MRTLPALFLALAATFAFTACSDNDDEPVNLGAEVASSYQGYTVASCRYFANQVAPDQTVKLSTVADNYNAVDVDFTSDTWGQFSIKNAEVSKSGDVYVISGTGTSTMGMGENINEYNCTLAGTVNGGVATFTFSCPAVMGGLSVEFLQGDIPASIVVPGTYNGYTNAKSAYFDGMTAEDETITVTDNGDGTFKVAFTSETWGEFTFNSVKATANGNNFDLSGEGTTAMGMSGNINNYPAELTATIDAAKENPVFTFKVPSVMGGVTIEFHTGELPTEE